MTVLPNIQPLHKPITFCQIHQVSLIGISNLQEIYLPKHLKVQ